MSAASSIPRKRVLMSAFVVSPVRGSEPGVGWNVPVREASYHDVTLLCATRAQGEDYRSEIEEYCDLHGHPDGLSFEYVGLPPLAWRLVRFQSNNPLSRALLYKGYAIWQRAAYRRALELHGRRPFDLAHHLSLTGFREPGFLWKLGIPFFWGPVAGASNMPWRFFGMMGWRDRLFYGTRNVINTWQMRHSRRSRRAARLARHIWVVGDDNRRLVCDTWGCRNASLLPDSGTCPRVAARIRKHDETGPLRLAWSGLHIGRKALPILLHALAGLGPGYPVELTILGGGAETVAWQDLAQHLGIRDRTHWTGQLPQAEAVARVAEADVFVFTSIQEGTPNVVLEALSLGLPVICHDACGMGAVVDDTCGIKVPLRNPACSIKGFAEAIRRLHCCPAEVARLSAGALRRADELSWDAKARVIAETYERTLVHWSMDR